MLHPHRPHRLPAYILSCLTAALLTTPLAAQVQIDYSEGQTDANPYDTSAPNNPTTLSILSGTATQSGVLSGSGQVIKAGAGTLILSGVNTYTNDTIIRAGTLQVVDGASFSQMNASLFVADQSGDVARLLISGGTVGFGFGGGDVSYIGNQAGSSGTVDVTGGTWTFGIQLRVGNDGTGVLNLSGGSGGSANGSGGAGNLDLGYNGSGNGTANVSGGTWVNGSLNVGYSGTGLLNISGGSLSNSVAYVGNQASSSGTANMSGGTWTTGTAFTVGLYGTGVLNLTGGTLDNAHSVNYIGGSVGGSGTANVSGGTWNAGSIYIGNGGTGVLNLTDHGTFNSTDTLFMGTNSGTGTLNIGTGGAAGTLNAPSISGGNGIAVVNFNHTGSITFSPTLEGLLDVRQSGPGTTTLTQASTYLGNTFVTGGTLELGFGAVSTNILPAFSTLYIGNGTLLLTGEGTQTVFKFYATGSGSIVLGQNQTLNLGLLGDISPVGAVNFNTAAGGADGATVGSGIIMLSGQTPGSAIHQSYTVTDTTGYGLATVNAFNQIIRATTDLLPASGTTYRDYRIDNNAGGSTVAGSSTLVVTSSQSVVSITVDTTASAGVLTLAPGVVLSSLIWNIGSIEGGGHAYEITGGASGGGITTNAGYSIQINNYNSAPLTISAPILNNGVNSGLQIAGPGTTILTAANTYIGSTSVSNGTLEVAAGGSISTTDSSSTIVDGSTSSVPTLLISGGSLSDTYSVVGLIAGGKATITGGSWNSSAYKRIGYNGTGVMTLSGGSVTNGEGTLGYGASSNGTANVSGGTWTNNGFLYIGAEGRGVLNISGSGSVSSSSTVLGSSSGSSGTVNMSGGSMSTAITTLGQSSGGSGTINISGGTWTDSGLGVGMGGTGVLNISGGTLTSSDFVYLGLSPNSSGTVTVSGTGSLVSSGILFNGNNAATFGVFGTAVLNLADSGTVTIGAESSGTLSLALFSGSSGTLNIGTGGAAGTLNAASIFGGDGTAVVNFNHTGSLSFSPTLDGNLTVNHIGPGTTTLTKANTYTGTTSVLGGTLELGFGTVSANIISSSSALTLGGGTLRLTGTGTQTVNGLTTVAGTGSSIVIGDSNTLDLGALTSADKGSSLNFNTAAGGANGGTVGSGVVLLSGQTAGNAINPGFTVTDSTGFGLATVNALNQIIRLTTTDLLPATGATAGTDYRIDNNDGGSSTAGSAALVVSASESARSITVDTTASSGILTLAPGTVISTDVWNFGGTGGNTYVITTDSVASGLTAATAAGMLQINNYNSSTVSINAPILDNGGSGLRVAGTGTTLLNGSATYTGETVISNGTVFINGDFTAATGSVTVENTATLSGVGTLGGNLHVQSGGVLKPGNFLGLGALSGISATFDSGSVFSLQGGGTLLTSLNLSGAATIAAGAILSLETTSDLTATSYTLITAASGLDSAHAFTLSAPLPTDFTLVYDGTTLKLVYTRPVTAYWTGKVDSNWSSLSSGTSNWATTVDGVTDTAALPGALTDVTFSATGVGSTQTNLDVDTTIKSLTIESDTGISGSGKQTLTVNNATTVNALLAINSSVNFLGKGDLTVGTAGTLAGSGKVELTPDRSIFVNGAISVGDPTALPGAQVLSLTTSGTGAIVMGADSVILVNLYTGAGLGDNTGISTAADQLNLHGILDASAGGTLVIGNQLVTPVFAGGDQWKVIDLNAGGGTINGHLAVNDSALGLATGFFGTFDQTTGIYSIADRRPELTAYSSGLAMANAEGQAIISGVQTGLNDINNHLFTLRSGGGEEEEDEESDGSIAASLDYGVVVGEGDGPEDKNPIAKRVKRSRQWEVFTTVNYGNVKLNPISTQSGVQIDSWASSVGIERHLSRGLTLGFAVTFLQSTQTYTGGLGKIDLEGPMLSAYLSYARKGFWGSLLYSFGVYDLGSQRNPGLGLPTAAGATNAYTNAIQYNTGWNFHFLQDRSLVTGPFIGIDYLHGTVDAYSETGGGAGALRYARQTFESLVTRVGWSTSKKFETTWAAITPQFRLSYERQNLKNNGTSVSLINAPFTATGGNQTPGQDYMVLGTGVNFQFTPDFSMLLGYQVQLFRNNMEAHFGSVRFGYKF